jgi:hypothetical protein
VRTEMEAGRCCRLIEGEVKRERDESSIIKTMK